MDLIVVFEKFGLPIAFLIVMIYLFIKADTKFSEERKAHRDERTEWRKSQNELQKETNQALRELTTVIKGVENKK